LNDQISSHSTRLASRRVQAHRGKRHEPAGDAARWYHYGGRDATSAAPFGNYVELESSFSQDLKDKLAKRGYHVRHGFGGYQAIMFDAKKHVYWDATETRKDGEAVGY